VRSASLVRTSAYRRLALIVVFCVAILAACSGDSQTAVDADADDSAQPAEGAEQIVQTTAAVAPTATPSATFIATPTATPTPAATPTPTSTPTPTPTPLVAQWTNPDLPPIVSLVNVVGDVILFEAHELETDRIVVIGIDAGTGAELHRTNHYPDNRLAGQIGSVSAGDESGVFLVTERDGQGGYLAAHDANTGMQRWRIAATGGTWLCDEAVCLFDRGAGILSRFDLETGDVVGRSDLYGSRIVSSTADVLVVDGPPPPNYQPQQDRVGTWPALVGFGDYGATELWTIDLEEIAAQTGVGLTPDTGWTSTSNETHIAQTLGATFDLSLPNLGVAGSGTTFGIDVETGEIEWVMANVNVCDGRGPFHDVAVLCEWERVINTPEDSPLYLRSVRGVELASGEERWTVSVPGDVLLNAVTYDITEETVSVTGSDVDIHVDRSTGEEPEEVTDGRMTTCVESSAEFVAASHNGRRTEIKFTRPERLVHCQDGEPVNFADVLRREGELSDQIAVTSDSGWFVGLEDGVLTGVSIAANAPDA